MKKDKSPKPKTSASKARPPKSDLQKRAEKKLKNGSGELKEFPKDTKTLIHELQVHQIELEMQNEELRTAQIQLEESRRKYVDLYDFAPVGYFTLDKNGLILEVNHMGASMLGADRSLLIKKPFTLFIQKDDKDLYCQNSRKLFRTKEKQTCDIRLVRKDRFSFYARLEYILSKDSDGCLDQMRMAVSDITGQKEAETLIKISEIRFRELFENISSGVAVYESVDNGSDFIFKDFNSAAEKIDKTKRETLLRKRVTEIFPGIRDFGLLDVFTRVWRTGKPENHPVSFYKDNKISGWRENFVYKLPSGEIVAVYDDVTGLKQAEEEKTRLYSELEQIIHVTSHDFRAPLVNVQGYNNEVKYSLDELLATLQRKDVPESVKNKLAVIIEKDIPESMQYISKSISKMDSLLSGLNQLLHSGRAELEMIEVDMNSLVRDVITTLEYQFKENGVKRVISELPSCKCDKDKINQVLANLLGNALKYLDPKRPGIIKISGENKGGQLVYCVADNGIGIPKEHLDKVFDLFHRVKNDKNGEGLGLSIVKKAVERHGGRVWLESKQGNGSTFCFSIPDRK